MCRRGQAWRFSSSYSLLATDIGRLRITSTRHEEAAASGGGGGATLLSTEFQARNHAALGHIDLVVGHGRSGVPLSSTRSISSGLTQTLSEDWLCKRALETPCHTRNATSPQDSQWSQMGNEK